MRLQKTLSRIAVISKRRWIYGRGWTYCKDHYVQGVQVHRLPFFLSLHAHLVLEEKIEDLWNIFGGAFREPKIILLIYDIIHGVICAYNMKQILEFWKNRS